ncbi:MAG: type II toxin-antitoxin system HicA family toxin [Caldilineaceae bacterium]|nr:type II toxin-antitoxin system HicA family toxin [Caldilineaceae bacterium]MBP8107114.1 type II toxin-antitoxin system HicA family toxin [Caldilineaceae bacterium]MBP8123620.1 type II toxin-antitoxin system HicA family toxin [Caldilineaceae bacterium]MBP9072583.1 type II toxin-antitoxin system HicA family toxin [Caldilineaceae bacterium]
MPRLPSLTSAKVVKALERAGFYQVRQTGSHARFRHDDGRVVTVPIHANQDIGRGLLRKILRDAELDRDEFLALFD